MSQFLGISPRESQANTIFKPTSSSFIHSAWEHIISPSMRLPRISIYVACKVMISLAENQLDEARKRWKSKGTRP